MIILRAITTKWLGPTNSRGSRVKATAGPGQSVTVGWDYGIANDRPGVSDIEGNHIAAAMELARRLGWGGVWAMGALPNGEGYAFVNAGELALGAHAFRIECDADGFGVQAHVMGAR